MVSLVYHALDGEPGALSPFVQHIHAIADGSRDLRIACPYIALAVLRPVLAKVKGWRLLTDADELLKNQPASQRSEWIQFLADHEKRVRHCSKLHAKVVAGDVSALVGSANLTEPGMGGRQEVGVLIDEPALVGELHAWFDELWHLCALPPRITLESFVAALPTVSPDSGCPHLPSEAPQIRARVFAHTEAGEAHTGEERLLDRLSHAVSREWIDAYLDMCADLLGTLRIDGEEERLTMNVPKEAVLPVILNQRYVLCAFGHSRNSLGLMLPKVLPLPAKLSARFTGEYQFKPFAGENPGELPWNPFFVVDSPRDLAPLRDDWLFAVRREAERSPRRSGFRGRNHVPSFYRAAVDAEYRRALLDEVFAPKCWWFGVNNGDRGHMQLRRCRAFLARGDARLQWPAGNSKPRKLYAQMHVGDRVLLWTGHGRNPNWGILGTARIGEVTEDGVMLANPEPFPKPLMPYRKGHPSETAEVSFLLTAFGDSFDALGDVRAAVRGTQHRPPVTVAAVPKDVFNLVVARARGAE